MYASDERVACLGQDRLEGGYSARIIKGVLYLSVCLSVYLFVLPAITWEQIKGFQWHQQQWIQGIPRKVSDAKKKKKERTEGRFVYGHTWRNCKRRLAISNTYIYIYIHIYNIETCGVWRTLPRSQLEIVRHQRVTSNPETSAWRLCQTDKDYIVNSS